MSSVLDQPIPDTQTTSAQRLKAITTAVRVAISWFGVSKSLTPEQKSQAADAFGAEGECISAGKKLLDCRHPAYKAVTNVRGRLLSYWKGLTLPYPEPGVRLIRQDDVQAFHVQMTTLKAELAEAVENLQQHYAELKRAAQRRLGSLYNGADYPDSLTNLFNVSWDFPFRRLTLPVLGGRENAGGNDPRAHRGGTNGPAILPDDVVPPGRSSDGPLHGPEHDLHGQHCSRIDGASVYALAAWSTA